MIESFLVDRRSSPGGLSLSFNGKDAPAINSRVWACRAAEIR